MRPCSTTTVYLGGWDANQFDSLTVAAPSQLYAESTSIPDAPLATFYP